MSRSLGIILKVSERCNLKCTYCYFFFSGDDSYKRHSPIITETAVEDLSAFIASEVMRHDMSVVQIDLHGGEPLLMKKSRFRAMLVALRAACSSAECRFSLQTNGVLIDNEWIDLLSEFEVSLSFSLDGPKHINDRARIDKQGRGSYDSVVAGIRLAQRGFRDGRLPVPPGALCVIDTESDPSEVYHHLVHDLGFDRLDFLLPDENHDSIGAPSTGRAGQYLVSVFDCWIADDNPKIHVRFIENYLGRILASADKRSIERDAFASRSVLTVSSDGHVSPDDVLRSAVPLVFADPPLVSEVTLDEVLASERIQEIELQVEKPPTECASCIWIDVCRGGDQAIHRYRSSTGFDNRSVYCADMDLMLTHMARYAVSNIIDRDTLVENLHAQ